MIELKLKKTLWDQDGDMPLDIDLGIEPGEFCTIYGKSGAGKTSILRMIAGLMIPDEGKIVVNGEIWFDSEKGVHLPPQKRKSGLLFQDYALFPHLSVLENILFAKPKNVDDAFIDYLVQSMELTQLKDRKPNVLSGGQRQRVALARALVYQPKLLLLDEPLSALDFTMRRNLQTMILEMHQSLELTTLLVSHDAPEIIRLSDTCILLDKGKIIRKGTPIEVLAGKSPGGKFQFVGEIIDIAIQDMVYVVTLLIDKNIVRVVVDKEDAKDIKAGDRVLVASKAFNPIIKKLI